MKNRLGSFYDELLVGNTVQHRATKTIFESDNNFFCLLTMNHHPIHLNLEFAKKHQHGKIMVVGTLVFSLAVGITVPEISGKAIANLEYERVQHISPVFINDTIRAETQILNKSMSTTKNDRGVVSVETTVFNQNNEKVLKFRRKVLIPVKREKK